MTRWMYSFVLTPSIHVYGMSSTGVPRSTCDLSAMATSLPMIAVSNALVVRFMAHWSMRCIVLCIWIWSTIWPPPPRPVYKGLSSWGELRDGSLARVWGCCEVVLWNGSWCWIAVWSWNGPGDCNCSAGRRSCKKQKGKGDGEATTLVLGCVPVLFSTFLGSAAKWLIYNLNDFWSCEVPFFDILRLQGDQHCACAQKWCHFSNFA